MQTTRLLILGIFLVAGIINTQGQSGDAIATPIIEKVDNFKELMQNRKALKSSTAYEYFLKPYDETPISLTRNAEQKAKLHVKGRGSLNYVEIYEFDATDEDYPIMSESIRGTNYRAMDLNRLGDGLYTVRVISNHNITETPMELKTLAAD